MSTESDNKKPKRGGQRPGAGRPKGSGTKVKICVSVDGKVWKTALIRWKDKGSHLVDMLLARFVQNKVAQ